MPTTLSAGPAPHTFGCGVLLNPHHHSISDIRQHSTEYMCTLCAPTRKRCLKYCCFPFYCYLGHMAIASPPPVSARCCYPIPAARLYSPCPRATCGRAHTRWSEPFSEGMYGLKARSRRSLVKEDRGSDAVTDLPTRHLYTLV